MTNNQPSLLSDDALPSFGNPPVVETVLGVQFAAIPGLTNAHLGAFWKTLGKEWPNVTDAPSLDPVYERFGDERSWGAPHFKLTNDPSTRLQIKNVTGDEMIQVQNGRLHLNWLGHGGREYPRYSAIRPEFDHVLAGLDGFLRDVGLEERNDNQWEVTYVNHMPKGTVWEEPSDWPKLFLGLPGAWNAPTRVSLEGVHGAWRYEISPKRGRLHIELDLVRLGSASGTEALRLTLTARGPVSQDITLDDGLNLGREAIVTSFKEITSPDAHHYWDIKK
jgi:uncharacterized protein (TIGR04255 family)